jgi:hypothetical protein
MKKSYSFKIDPCLRNLANISPDESLNVILHTKQFERCLPVLNEMGIKAIVKIPLIKGYIVEIPSSMLNKLAGCKEIRFIAADLDVKAQIPIRNIDRE